MRKFFIAFLLFSNCALAQNWNLFPLKDTLCYQKINSTYITNTVVINKILYGNDSVFASSGSMLPCYNCTTVKGEYYSHQPDFIKYFYSIDRNSKIKLFKQNSYNETDTNYLYTTKEVGFNWTFKNGVTASIISKKQFEIFSVLDSVKTISFSNGDSLVISKNFGVIHYKHPNVGYLKLVGNHSRKIGLQLFNIGKYNILKKNDYFRINETAYYYDGTNPCYRTDIETFKIKSVQKANGMIHYTCDTKVHSFGLEGCNGISQMFDWNTFNTAKVISLPINQYLLPNEFQYNQTIYLGSFYNISSISIRNGDTIINLNGADNRHFLSKKFLVAGLDYDKVDSLKSLYNWYNYPIAIMNKSEEKVGKVKCDRKFEGYIKNGISYGLTDTNVYLGVNNIKLITFSVYPQPNNGEFTIAFNDFVITGNINVSIIDLNGRIVFTKEYDENNLLKVETTTLQNGVYILKINIGEEESYQKLIIDQNTSQ